MSASQHGPGPVLCPSVLPSHRPLLPVPLQPAATHRPRACTVGARRRRAACVTSATQSSGTPQTRESASENFIDLFSRASTPMGTFQRAEAALAAARAMAADNSTKEAPQQPQPLPVGATAARPGRYDIENATLDSVLGVEAPAGTRGRGTGGGGSGGGGGGGASAGAAKEKKAATPGPDFWSWTPEELHAQRGASSAAEPALQRAKPKAKAQAAEVMDRPAEVSLPPMQSAVDMPSWQEALLLRMAPPSVGTAAGAPTAATAQDTSVSDAAQSEASSALAAAAEALSLAADSGPASGMRADGTRWWSESGTEELADGRVCVWTLLRGVSADGSTEWQDKSWRTSDAWGYRELGAEKTGRSSSGAAWRECWHEVYDTRQPVASIVRNADKWGTDAVGAEWHERWSEAFTADGAVERTAHKFGRVARGIIPEDGHAAEWTERWGETWDGHGFARKWADRWAGRDEREGGGAGRKWGEHWTQEFNAQRQGARWGEAWSDDPGGGGWYSRKWGEDHHGNGGVRKWGNATDGQAWDVESQEDTWYEGHSNFGWHDALRHSPQLLNVPLRPRTAGEGDAPPGVLGKPGKRRGGK